jgi:large subunit ribosomal protein L23
MAKKDTQKKTEVAVENKVIIAPRITEKASMQSSDNAYTFVVAQSATKHSIAAEIKKEYKVTPLAVNITKLPGKVKLVRGKFGKTAPTKKAIVFLKKGDTIKLA